MYLYLSLKLSLAVAEKAGQQGFDWSMGLHFCAIQGWFYRSTPELYKRTIQGLYYRSTPELFKRSTPDQVQEVNSGVADQVH